MDVSWVGPLPGVIYDRGKTKEGNRVKEVFPVVENEQIVGQDSDDGVGGNQVGVVRGSYETPSRRGSYYLENLVVCHKCRL